MIFNLFDKIQQESLLWILINLSKSGHVTEETIDLFRIVHCMVFVFKWAEICVIANILTSWEAFSNFMPFCLQVIDKVINVESCLDAMTFFLVLPYALIHWLISILIRNPKAFDVLSLYFNVELSWPLIHSHMEHNIMIVKITLFFFVLLYQRINFAVDLSQSFVTMLDWDSDNVVLEKCHTIDRVNLK